jgi:saccharopine dehydrogenase (NAD+, L-lysine-forming)
MLTDFLDTGDLLPSLLALNDWQNTPVWARAEKLFKDKVATLPASALEK